MSFSRSFNPSIVYSENVKALANQSSSRIEDGTSKSNDVAEKDLAYWIPVAGPFLNEGVKPVKTLEELLKLPKAHIGHVLATILPIYRQKRHVNGKRYTNASLKLKVEAWQRVIRGIYQKEYNDAVLKDPHVQPKTFNVYSDPELQLVVQQLNKEMQVSAAKGLTLGLKKRSRGMITPEDLKSILQLWNLKKPVDVEHVFAITIMMSTGARGGEELRSMH